jgi:hypothetical protein
MITQGKKVTTKGGSMQRFFMGITILAALTGCASTKSSTGGGGGGGGSGRPAPNELAKPAGSGWYCTRDNAVAAFSLCDRDSGMCQERKMRLEASAQNQGFRTAFTGCDRVESAICYTLFDLQTNQPTFDCYLSHNDCEQSRGVIEREMGQEYSDFSECGSWQ